MREAGGFKGLAAALFQPPRAGTDGHLYVIDLMRGLAALTVVVFHFADFPYTTLGVEPEGHFETTFPLYPLLWPIYDYGQDAVHLFWLISGFVFCAVYARRDTGTREFVVNRFARLYPLHFLTLVAVLLLQIASMALVGHHQIFANTDAYHFVLHVFFASQWGFQSGHSYNVPIWSVSIEVVIYAVFWATRSWLYRWGVLGPLVLALACWPFAFHMGLAQGRFFECALYFFTGTAIWLAFDRLRGLPGAILACGLASIAAGLAIDIAFAADHHYHIARPLEVVGMLLTACAFEAWGKGRGGRLQWIGDNTYGTYLWHVPIQIAALIFLDAVIGSRAVIYSPAFLIFYVVIVCIVGRISYVAFEKPARKWVRKRFEVKRPNEEIPAP